MTFTACQAKAWVSLAEGHARLGDNASASECYAHALKIKPDMVLLLRAAADVAQPSAKPPRTTWPKEARQRWMDDKAPRTPFLASRCSVSPRRLTVQVSTRATSPGVLAGEVVPSGTFFVN